MTEKRIAIVGLNSCVNHRLALEYSKLPILETADSEWKTSITDPGKFLKPESLEKGLLYVNNTRSYRNDFAHLWLGRIQGTYKARAMVKRLKNKNK